VRLPRLQRRHRSGDNGLWDLGLGLVNA
jgi:hypothetical protein